MTEDANQQHRPGLSPTALATNHHAGTGSSGAWVLWLAGIILLGMTVWAVWKIIESTPTLPADRPKNPQAVWTLGFDLDNAIVPRETIYSAGPTKDGIPALTDPSVVEGVDVTAINEKMHGKFLVNGERVIGVELNGESRAYPLSILTWHEVINDELGGVPIVVTYCPLCDAAAVFKRSVGDEILEFGVSGLLHNSNLLLYDRRGKRDSVKESLWSQLRMAAIAGPAADAGTKLEVVPSVLAHWGEWLQQHPQTTVVEFPTKYDRDYAENPYMNLFLDGELPFPVEPKPAGGLAPMTRLVAVRCDDRWLPYYYDVPGQEQPRKAKAWQQDGLRFSYTPVSAGMDPPVVSVTSADGSALEVAYSFWAPWYAMHPDGAEPVALEIPQAD